MKKLSFIVALCAAIILTSCMGLNTTSMPNDPVQTQVRLEQKNFKVVKQVEGVYTGKYYFGIGGYSKKGLENSAISNMYSNADLKGSQTIVNVTTVTSTKFVFFPIYFKKYCKAVGTVIEFTGEK